MDDNHNIYLANMMKWVSHKIEVLVHRVDCIMKIGAKRRKECGEGEYKTLNCNTDSECETGVQRCQEKVCVKCSEDPCDYSGDEGPAAGGDKEGK